MHPISMSTVMLNGHRTAYAVQGSGEPLLLLHCGFLADSFVPLLAQPGLADRCQLIHYHRRGYGQSQRAAGPASLAELAGDARALLDELGIARAHVAGHSIGGAIALQLALDAPERVRSLGLFEPTLPAAMADPAAAQFFMETVGKAFALFAAGDPAGAVDTWLSGACGPNWQAAAEQAVPGSAAQAVVDAPAVFLVEAPALQQWSFTAAEAARLTMPVLSAYHDEPRWPGFQKTHDLLTAWLPQTEACYLPVPSHLLPMQAPAPAAEALTGFLARHALVPQGT